MKKALVLIFTVLWGIGLLSGCNEKEKINMENSSSLTEESSAETEKNDLSFDNLVDLKDYFLKCMSEGNYSPKYCYTGDNAPDAGTICRMTCTAYCNIKVDTEDPQYLIAVMKEFPGDRMIRAYNTGDMSILNDSEKEALDIAVKAVEEAKSESDSDLLLELKIHDWLCDKITYDDSTRSVLDPENIPTNLTAVGALVNGAANCQGYTDAFYVMGRIAGFTVDRQYCQENSGGYHVINNIKLNDQWSVVDITYDDNSVRLETETIPDGHMFNVGLDIINQEYSWPKEFEHHPIVETTTDDYFYFTKENEKHDVFGQAFNNVEDMGKTIVQQWNENGRTYFHTMLKGKNAEWSDLKDAILSEMESIGKSNPFYTTSVPKGENSFFTVNFNK